jgi:hypothetical protein
MVESSLSDILPYSGNRAKFQTEFDLETTWTIGVIATLCQQLSLPSKQFNRLGNLAEMIRIFQFLTDVGQIR